MIKRIIIILSVIVVLLLLFIIIQTALKPRPFNWIPTYSSYDKQPYGGALIFRQLKNIFPGKKVKRFGTDDLSKYYWHIEDNMEYYDEDGRIVRDSTLLLYDMEDDLSEVQQFNVVMINDFFYCDDLNARALLLHAYQGNEVFIASNTWNEVINKYIHIDTEEDSIPSGQEYADGFVISAHDNLPVQLKSYNHYSHISTYPDSAVIIAKNKSNQVLGVRVKIGSGSLSYFSIPLIFTNYYLLKQENTLAENLLLALPNRDTYWGNMIMGSKIYDDRESLLSYIHSQESLTWAFYITVLGVLFLFMFQVKRKQRIIPVISKPENESLRFIEVITNLYLLNKDNKSLLRKKMTFFLESIRSKYFLNTSQIDEMFYEQLASKSKVDIKHIKAIFRDYNILDKQKNIPNSELLYFNRKLQHFKHR